MPRRDYALNIVADIKDYQRRLAEIPGITDRQAAKAAQRLEKRMSAAQAKTAAAAKRAATQSTVSLRSVQGALTSLSPAASQAAGAVESIGSVGGPAVAGLAGPIGIALAAVAALGAGAYQAASRMSELVDEANLLSEATGLSVETTQALSYALSAGGSSIERARSGLGEFTKRLGDAAKKGGEAAQVFRDYGIEIKNTDGTLRDADDVFRDALQAIDSYSNETERAAARARLFGNEASRALAALDPNTLQTAEERTRGLSAAIDDAERSSAEWDRAFAELNTSIDELTVALGDEFAEDIVTVVDGLADAVHWTSQWSDEIGLLQDQMAHGVWAFAEEDFFDYIFGVDEMTAKTRELKAQWEEARKEARRLADETAALDGMFVGPQMPDDMLAEMREKQREQEAEDEERAKRAEARAKRVAEARKAAALSANEFIREIDAEQEAEQEAQVQLAEERYLAQAERERARREQKIEEEAELHARMTAFGEQLDAERAEWAAREMARRKQAQQLQMNLAQTAFDTIIALGERMGDKQKKWARAAAIAQRASALFSIAVSTAQAMMQAVATIPPPGGPAVAAGYGVMGGVQAGLVLSEPLPQAHTGTSRVGGTAENVPMALTPNEAVLTPAAADTLGRGFIDAINQGMRPSGGPTTANVMLNDRSLDRLLARGARMDGQFGQMVRNNGSAIMRSPFL